MPFFRQTEKLRKLNRKQSKVDFIKNAYLKVEPYFSADDCEKQ